MKIALSIASSLFLFANLASANPFAKVGTGYNYKSSGEWSDNEGAKGTWTATSKLGTLENGNTGYECVTLVQIGENQQTHEEKMEFKDTGHDFFDVLVNGAKVGNGYCLKDVCHYQSTKDGMSAEETFEFLNDYSSFNQIGSVSYPLQNGAEGRTAWIGSGVKVD